LAIDEKKSQNEAGLLQDGGDKKKRFDYDGFWKKLVGRFFYPLLKRALPELYKDVDLSKPPIFLDKEFTDVLNTADPKTRVSPHFADSLLKVPLKDGNDRWILLHLEHQRKNIRGLAARMNRYRCFICAHYDVEPVALAIITKGLGKRERFYSHCLYGSKVLYEYNNLVLAELDDEELASSDNPIDLVLLAAKFSQNAREELRKFNVLRKAVELLDERGWSAEDKRDLFLFTEVIVNMKDKELRSRYAEFIEQRNREGKSMYIPLMLRDSAAEIKRSGFEEGKIDGKLEGKLEDARNMLAKGISRDIITEITGLPAERIQGLLN
jgi:hypothetical protein